MFEFFNRIDPQRKFAICRISVLLSGRETYYSHVDDGERAQSAPIEQRIRYKIHAPDLIDCGDERLGWRSRAALLRRGRLCRSDSPSLR